MRKCRRFKKNVGKFINAYPNIPFFALPEILNQCYHLFKLDPENFEGVGDLIITPIADGIMRLPVRSEALAIVKAHWLLANHIADLTENTGIELEGMDDLPAKLRTLAVELFYAAIAIQVDPKDGQ